MKFCIPVVPAPVVTLTPIVPAASAGAVATICVADTTVKLLAATEPNATALAPDKLLPVSVT